MADLVRLAEQLWTEWTGVGYEPMGFRSATYYTIGHINTDEQIVVGGLASLMQREGLVDSLSAGRSAITAASFVFWSHAGIVDGDLELTICAPDGETFYGDIAEDVVEITLVEVIGVAAL
ncbi:MAG: hypothetical protein ACRC5T_03610 [Cetobacterium sp.]